MIDVQRNSPSLRLGEAFLGDEGCSVVGKYLEEHDTFSVIDLHGNNITGAGIINLCKYLSKTEALKEYLFVHIIHRFSLEWNSLGQSAQGLEMLCGALGENKSITNVDLRNNKIGGNAYMYLSNLIRMNNTLQVLDLRWNELGTEGAKGLIAALEKNRSLTQLELSGNKITEEVLNIIGISFD